MVFFRKVLVSFFASILLIALLAGVTTLGFNRGFSKPDNIKTWLAESKVYDNVVSAALNSSQEDSSKSGGDNSISLKDPIVQQAAKAAFSPQLLQTSANTFIDANYAWLTGKTAKPDFAIDFSKAKQSFAQMVGTAVQDRLKKLPVCTPQQQTQLQLPINSLTATCRPPSLDPKTEGTRVTNEISTNDFLSKPVITADTLGHDQNNPNSKPYYQTAAKAPQLYRIEQKAPWILASLAFICALIIIVLAQERRRGWRRVGSVLLTAGVILLISNLMSHVAANRLINLNTNNTVSVQLKEPRKLLINHVVSQLTQTSLIFGIIFIVLALTILLYLFATREGRARKPAKTKPSPIASEDVDNEDVRPAPRQKPVAMDVMSPDQRPTGPPVFKQPRPTEKPKGPKPPRLIQ